MVSGNAIVYIYFISNCKTSKCDKEKSIKSLSVWAESDRVFSRVVLSWDFIWENQHINRSTDVSECEAHERKPQLKQSQTESRVHDCDTHNSILAFQFIILFFMNIFVCVCVCVNGFDLCFCFCISKCVSVAFIMRCSFAFVFVSVCFVACSVVYSNFTYVKRIIYVFCASIMPHTSTSHFITANQNTNRKRNWTATYTKRERYVC